MARMSAKDVQLKKIALPVGVVHSGGGLSHTVNRFALRQISVVLAREQRITIATDDTLNVSACDVVKHSLGHGCD
jgi:hypothetical protein